GKHHSGLHLNLPIWNETGVQLMVLDINQDRRADLIVTSVASLNPIAIWLNKGKGTFERTVMPFGSLLEKERGSHFRRSTNLRTENQAIIPTFDPSGDLVVPEQLKSGFVSARAQELVDRLLLTSDESGCPSPRGPPVLSLL